MHGANKAPTWRNYMKKPVVALLVMCLIAIPTPASAQTTVRVDHNKSKVQIQSGDFNKTLKYQTKTIYATKKTKLYTAPKKEAVTKITISKGKKLNRIAKGENYSVVTYKVKGKRGYYFVRNSNFSTKKPVKKAKLKVIYTASHFKRMGVIKWSGYRWTWYSQRVLPGGGLKIPGRHVDSSGYVCDKDERICLASSTLKRGTVLKTPFGKEGKIYDSGCAAGTLDVYVNF